MKNNFEWFNSLKVFGILAVILGHINNPFNVFIYSWHMPLFFLISGFFIKPEVNFRTLVIKDLKRLMVPYFIFAVIAIVVTSLKLWALGREPLAYLYEFKAIFFWMDMEHLANSYAFVLWFLPALFFAKLLYYIVTKVVENDYFRFLIFIFLFLCSFYIKLPLALTNAMNAALWLFVGTYLWKLFNSQRKYIFGINSLEWPLLLSITLIMTTYLYIGMPSLNMSLVDYDSPFFNVMWATAFVYILMYLCQKINAPEMQTRFVGMWGKNTMLLFILHPYTNNIAHIFIEKLSLDAWYLKLFFSLILLQLILLLKIKYSNSWVFKYV